MKRVASIWATDGERTITVPYEEMGELEWRLRYGAPTKHYLMTAASIIDNYRYLTTTTDRQRRSFIRLRSALSLPRQSAGRKA
jgi:hypothetical protein